MKNFLTMWQFWAVIAGVLALILVFRADNFLSILPFAILIICPIMMMFMMGSHKHK